jgi:hypothetical protein
MAAYAAPVDDVAFLLEKVFDFDRCMAEIPAHEEVNTELAVSPEAFAGGATALTGIEAAGMAVVMAAETRLGGGPLVGRSAGRQVISGPM